MALPTCECVGELPPNEKLSAIYCAIYTLAQGDPDGPFLLKSANLSDVDDAFASRTSLGGTTAGQSFFTLANPGAITFPRINADNTVTARSAADFRTDIGIISKVKDADEARSNNTVLTNDSVLTAAVVSGRTYIFECMVRFAMASSVPGVGFAINSPTTSLFSYMYTQTRGATFDGNNQVTSSATVTYIETVTSVDLLIRGTIVATASGTLALAWRQSNTSAAATTSKAGSYLKVQEV